MNRLTGITLSRPSGQDLACAVTYDALGRMTSKQAVTAVNGVAQVSAVLSQPVFNATKVHAVSSAQNMSDMFPTGAQNITYTSFEKAGKIKLDMDSLCYTYGYDQQRIGMEEYIGSSVRTKQYVGSCEYITETGTSGTKTLTYLTGPYGVFAVVEKQNNAETLHYILKDNLGSWTTITNGNGAVEQRLSFDAWGNQRNPNTWANYTANDTYSKPMFDRGFTGHEHLTAFGLINMNGRMYDPVMSSFLSADRFVQNPMSAQGFNRYAYCMNNPLRFVDPTGWAPRPGGGHGPDDPPPYVVIEGWASGYKLDEVIITDTPLFNDEFEYTPYYNTGGGGDLPWGMSDNYQSNNQNSGGGGGNQGNGIKYMLLDYHQKYHHHRQTDVKGCKIATVRSYYQYFSGIDKGEADFSTIANGMIAVDNDTYLLEYYEACGLNVSNGMNVNIIEIGHQLEEGHPYSIVLKGERASDINHVVTMVGIYKENADSTLKVFIKDPMQENGQYYKWVDFREEIKDAYFITGLKKHRL